MKRDYPNNNHTKDKKEIISVGLLCASAVMVVLMVIKVTGFLAAPVRAEDSLNKATARSKLNDEEVKKHLDASKAIADELKKKNLFAPPPPKKHPVKQVSGILGDEVLINGKWYKVSNKVGDAIIVAVEPTQVKIEWEGNEKVFAPISSVSAPEPKKVVTKAVVKKDGPKKVEKAVEKKAETVSAEDPFAGLTLSAKLREKFLERWNKSSDEEKQKMKEQWNNIPDGQKQQMIDQMEQNIDKL